MFLTRVRMNSGIIIKKRIIRRDTRMDRMLGMMEEEGISERSFSFSHLHSQSFFMFCPNNSCRYDINALLFGTLLSSMGSPTVPSLSRSLVPPKSPSKLSRPSRPYSTPSLPTLSLPRSLRNRLDQIRLDPRRIRVDALSGRRARRRDPMKRDWRG